MKKHLLLLLIIFFLPQITHAALTDNLVAYWDLDEASGVRDDAVGQNDLTDNNTVTSGTGKISNAGDFERDNSEYLSRADNTDLSSGNIDFTWAGWVKAESNLDSNSGRYIVSKHGASGNFEYGISHNDSATVERFQFNVSSTGSNFVTVNADSLGTPSLDTWYFVVAWHDATANTINIQVNNGTVDSTSHTTGVFDGNGTFALGSYAQTPTNFFDGMIDEMGFWKRVLTADERTELYNSGNGLAYPFDYTLLDDIAGYWKMEEGSGTNRNDEVGSNDLTPGILPNAGTGIINNGSDFVPASFTFTENADNSTFSMGSGVDFTISTWVKTDASPNYQLVYAKDSVALEYHLRLYGGGDNKFHFLVNAGAADLTGTTNISTGTWYHIVVTYDGTNLRMYNNGTLETTTAFTSDVTDGTSVFEVGRSAGVGGGYWDGIIDEIGLWKRELSQDEITDLYNAGAGLPFEDFGGGDPEPTPYSCSAMFCLNAPMFVRAPMSIGKSISVTAAQSSLIEDLVAYWKLDEASGTRADSTGRGNDLTDNNTVTSRTGKVGDAASFDPLVGEWLDVADNADVSLTDTDWTVSAWYNEDTTADYRAIGFKDDGLQLFLDTAGNAYYRTGGFHDTVAATGLSTGTWYHVVMWWEASTNTKYISFDNGTPVSVAGVTAPTDTAAFTLGKYPNFAGFYFDGMIDEVGVWKRILTSDERTALYNGGSGTTYPF